MKERVLAVAVPLTFGLLGIWLENAGGQDAALKPISGSKKLVSGFEPDPFVKEVRAGGDMPNEKFGVFLAKEPTFVLEYTKGKVTTPLIIHAESKKAIALVVLPPDGKLVGGGVGKESIYRFPEPQYGKYVIWVGTLDKGNAEATLNISKKEPAKK